MVLKARILYALSFPLSLQWKKKNSPSRLSASALHHALPPRRRPAPPPLLFRREGNRATPRRPRVYNGAAFSVGSLWSLPSRRAWMQQGSANAHIVRQPLLRGQTLQALRALAKGTRVCAGLRRRNTHARARGGVVTKPHTHTHTHTLCVRHSQASANGFIGLALLPHEQGYQYERPTPRLHSHK